VLFGTVFFIPFLDTLYAPHESNNINNSGPWILGPAGVLTQLKKEHGGVRDRIRSFAVDLAVHGRPDVPLRWIRDDFRFVREIVFVVDLRRQGYGELLEELGRVGRGVRGALARSVEGWKVREEDGEGDGEGERERKRICPSARLAMSCKGDLQFVEIEEIED
jgi:hypothetical protein